MCKEANKEQRPRYSLARARLEYILRYGNEEIRARLIKLLKELRAKT
jgi:hypothetical protein